MSRRLLIFCCLLLAGASPIKGQTPDAQERARQTIRGVFKEEYAKAETDRAARRALSFTLWRQGRDTKDDDNLRYIAWDEAFQLAGRAGDVLLGELVLQDRSLAFKLPSEIDQLMLLESAGRAALDPPSKIALTRRAFTELQQAQSSGRFFVVPRLATLAKSLVQETKVPSLLAEADRLAARSEYLVKETQFIDQAKAKSTAVPDDRSGRYLCFVKGAWDKGLPLLAKSKDSTLSDLARKDLARPTAAKDILALAEAWRALGDGAEFGDFAQARALHWYADALARLQGLERLRVQEHIDTLVARWPHLQPGEPASRMAHAEGVAALAVTPDGQRLVSAGWDHTLLVSELATGRELARLRGHTEEVFALAVSSDGKHALTGGRDRSVRLWDLNERKQLKRLDGHTDQVRGVAFSPDDKLAASVGDDRTLRLWELSTGRELWKIEAQAGPIEAVAFSPDGKLLATAGWDKSIKLWDVAARKELRTFRGHQGGIYRVAFSPDGNFLASASADESARLWDTATGEECRTYLGHKGHVIALAFSPDGRRLLTGGGKEDDTLRLWDLVTGREVQRFNSQADGVWSATFAPTVARVISGGADGKVRVWGY